MSPARASLLLATLLVGLSAGFFFTYEASVTLGLAEVSDTAYVETFQALNRTVRNPAFGIVFFGSVPAIAIALAANWSTTRPVSRILMSMVLPLYLAGLIITAVGNVPLNDDLADIRVTTPAIASVARADYEDDWNRLNLIRTLAIVASFAALAAASAAVSSRSGDGRGAPDAAQTG